ncbi:hypothetical protein PILCRDRAFT_380072 [Piloderma croceum F 1598]|uniref:DUF6533 domain-containing protein n=1 Tax=Piloderma croceum (strain F 1598) TaxID=765440 RepID=A0A0C3G333_PILCF|nr:hypothetical protein PILCRDRAFT_380072 [Piloderma croceum F 1598]
MQTLHLHFCESPGNQTLPVTESFVKSLHDGPRSTSAPLQIPHQPYIKTTLRCHRQRWQSSFCRAYPSSFTLTIHHACIVACVTLWGYDHCLTFASEASLIWNAPWTFPKVLYIVTRYWSSVTLIILLYFHFSHDISVKNCLIFQRFVTWSINIGMCSAEVILTIRTWAVWERSRKVAIFLSIFFAAIWISGFIIMGFWEGSVEYIPVPREMVPSGCWPHVTSPLYFVSYILIAVFEGVLLIMMSIKGYTTFNDGPVNFKFFQAVYIDGILYYIYLFTLSVINIMINMHISKYYANLLAVFQQIMHSLLAGRMLLKLRQWGKQSVRGDQFEDFGSSFAAHVNSLVFEAALVPIEEEFADTNDTETTPMMLTSDP